MNTEELKKVLAGLDELNMWPAPWLRVIRETLILISERLDAIEARPVVKEPHVCPVCNGMGRVTWPVSTTATPDMVCPACKGACVLWEPKEKPNAD